MCRQGGANPTNTKLGNVVEEAPQEPEGEWAFPLLGSLTATVPLAPRLVFPPIGAPGVLATFSDAADEAGTGIGGWSTVRWASEQAARFPSQGNIKEGGRGIRKLRKRSTGDAAALGMWVHLERRERDVSGAKKRGGERDIRNVALL